MIKIKNIYYMLSYAFRILTEDKFSDIALEEFENAANLFAAILTKGITNQVRVGLRKEYVEEKSSLFSPHGKINITDSLKIDFLLKKQLSCSYDVFSENTYINKILKTTVQILIKSEEVKQNQKKALKKVLLFFQDVDRIEVKSIQWSSISYNRNNVSYKMLIYICYLVIEGLLFTEENGRYKLAKYVDDQKMSVLYEKFILEYYRKHYPQFKPSAAHINWNIENGFTQLLPKMKSDITLEFQGKTIIIDAKYYSRMLQYNKRFQSQTLHSNNMYQIFAYVKNKDTKNTGNVSGILLYAKTEEESMLNQDYIISGNPISVKSLDLSGEFREITWQLDKIADTLLGN